MTTVRTELEFPPADRETLDRLSVAEGPTGDTLEDSETVPLKPLTPIRKMLEVATEPVLIARLPGSATIRKSGVAEGDQRLVLVMRVDACPTEW